MTAKIYDIDLLEDKALLVRLGNNEVDAFNKIYDKYWQLMYDAAAKRMTSSGQAEDIVQDVFLKIWKNRLAFDHVENLKAYLLTTLRNAILNFLTRHANRHVFFDTYDQIVQFAVPAFSNGSYPLVTGPDGASDANLMARDLQALIVAYANTLSPKRREILLLYLQQRLSSQEMANILHVSTKTVQNTLRTAINGLRTQVNPLILAIIFSRF